MAICSARAPIMRAFSYFVYSFLSSVKISSFPYVLCGERMGLLRFELRSRRPERRRIDQATLQPLHLYLPFTPLFIGRYLIYQLCMR